MKLAFDMTFPHRVGGGSGAYARSLAHTLGQRNDVVISEIALHGGGLPRTLDWLLRGARRAVRLHGAQLLHAPAFVTPWRSPVPFVITMHDAASLRFPRDYPLEWRLYNRFFLPPLARQAAAVITGTRAMRAELSRCYRIEPRAIHITQYGIDEQYHRPVDMSAVAAMRARLAHEGPILLFAGAPIRRKNLDLVLQAMAHAPPGSKLSQVCLVISAASAEQFPAYHDWTVEHGLEGRVRWLGDVAFEQMPALYATCDLLVYPSYYEGFGFPPLEAMAVGTPVVASTAPCLPEVLGDGALTVGPTDEVGFASAVEAALASSELRSRLVEAGKARAARYTWARCAEETCSVYRAVLS